MMIVITINIILNILLWRGNVSASCLSSVVSLLPKYDCCWKHLDDASQYRASDQSSLYWFSVMCPPYCSEVAYRAKAQQTRVRVPVHIADHMSRGCCCSCIIHLCAPSRWCKPWRSWRNRIPICRVRSTFWGSRLDLVRTTHRWDTRWARRLWKAHHQHR